MATDTIKFKRGTKNKLDKLSYGEPAFISDEGELYIGTESGVEKLTRNKEVEGLTSQLEHIKNKFYEINVKDFGAKGDGITDDTKAIQEALNNIPYNGVLRFEPYATYKTTSALYKHGSDFTIEGNNSTIDYKGIDIENILTVGGYLKNSFKKLSYIQIKEQNNYINLSGFQDIYNSIEIGDTLLLTDSDSDNNGYKDGLLTVVTHKENTFITVSNLAHKDINATDILVYSKSENISVNNLNINSSGSMRSIGLQINAVNKFKVFNCNMNGDKGRQGINAFGFNGNILNCTANNFFDELLIDNRTGYGVAVSGKNITVEKCVLENCKHTISASDRRYYSTNIIYRDNIFKGCAKENVSLCEAIVDIHGNAEGIVENNLIDAGEYHSGYLMYFRNNNIFVKNNIIRNTRKNNQKAICFSDIAVSNIVIDNNTVYGEGSIYIETDKENLSNITICNNKLENGFINIGGKETQTFKNLNISNNIVYGNCLQFLCTLKDVIISNNIFTAYDYNWRTCIGLGDSTQSKNILINSNKLKHFGNGGTPIRFSCNNVSITNNIIEYPSGNPINNMNSSESVLVSNNMIDRGSSHEIM